MRPQLSFTDRLGPRFEPLSPLALPGLRSHLGLILDGRSFAETRYHFDPLGELLRGSQKTTRPRSWGLLSARENLVFEFFERDDDLAM